MNPQDHTANRSRLNVRSTSGTLVALIGALMVVLGIAVPATAGVSTPVQSIPLGNDRADVGSDCPDDRGDYWHFVLAPNNGTYAFVSITLNLGQATPSYTGGDIIPNGTQRDNVFVGVPAGFEIDDLLATGSSAVISPPDSKVKFLLSHLCRGSSTPTTAPSTTQPGSPTTTQPATTTTAPDNPAAPTTTDNPTPTTTTAPDNPAAPTTTISGNNGAPTTTDNPTPTEPTTTTTAPDNPAAPTTTISGNSGAPTTSLVASRGPTTTTIVEGGNAPTTTALVASRAATTTSVAGVLPQTGSTSTSPLVAAGVGLVVLGGVMLLGARRAAFR